MARQGLIRGIQVLLRPSDASTFFVRQRVAAAIAASYEIVWPAALPTSQQAFTIDASGNVGWQALAGGGGTVTTLSVPTAVFGVSTPSTTPNITLNSQAQNSVFAGPSSGGAGTPAFRSLVAGDIPKALDNTWITDFVTTVRAQRLDQMTAPTANVSLNGQKITGIADATSNTDVPSWLQVQALFNGQDNKASVRVASVATVTVSSAPSAIDGVNLVANDRILLKNQSSGQENGVYTFASAGAPLVRAVDSDTSAEFTTGLNVFVESGTQAATLWFLNTPAPIAIGTTPVTFTQVGAGAAYIGGAGLTLTGNTFDVVGTANRIAVAADSIDISSNYVGQASITTLGTIATGTWNGTTIAVANGGTGATTAAGARTNLGAAGTFRATFTSSSGTNGVTVASNVVTIPHNLGQKVVEIIICDPAGKRVMADDTTFSNSSTASLDFSILGIASGTWELLVVG